MLVSPVAGTDKRAIPSVQSVLAVSIPPRCALNDATPSSLANPTNMHKKAAITVNPPFINITVAMYDIKIILVFISMF